MKMDITPSKLKSLDAWYWAGRENILLDGRPLDWARHLYQVEPLRETFPEEATMKGAQIGWTSKEAIKTIHGLLHGRYPQGVLCLFPTRDDVTDFSKGRYGPLIADNPGIARHVSETDAANIKRVGKSMLYFRGTGSRSQLKSVPVDKIIFDEIDEMEPKQVDLAMERVSHSEVREISYLSTPTLPDYGIDLRWQRSDQRRWFIKCRRCNSETCLELEFEENGWEKQRVLIEVGGSIIRACKHCQAEIYPHDGAWRITRPEFTKDLVGRQISQLNSYYVPPKAILDAFKDPARSMTETYNSKIGLPYVDAKNRLGVDQVLTLCGSHGIASKDRGPCSMGVDQGPAGETSNFHVVIGRKHEFKAGILPYVGTVGTWAELDDLMVAFHVYRCVVDALPEPAKARAFAQRHPGKVFMSYYQEGQRGSYLWDEGKHEVASNRTENLDASHVEIAEAKIILPKRSEIVETFAKHLHNTAKKLIVDEETGSRVYRYLKLGPDHFRHAFTLESMARNYGATGMFARGDLS